MGTGGPERVLREIEREREEVAGAVDWVSNEWERRMKERAIEAWAGRLVDARRDARVLREAAERVVAYLVVCEQAEGAVAAKLVKQVEACKKKTEDVAMNGERLRSVLEGLRERVVRAKARTGEVAESTAETLVAGWQQFDARSPASNYASTVLA
jgi:hypothetical protein